MIPEHPILHLAADEVGQLPAVLQPLVEDLARVGARYESILSGAGHESRHIVAETSGFSGKRLRPALTCLAARLGPRGLSEDAVTVAAIVELIHAATLVHDDVIDGAAFRRATPTTNARWGDQAAVLAGDVLFCRAYRTASWLEDRFASRYLADTVAEVLEGEILQDRVAFDAQTSEETYLRIIRGKTAALYESALRVGAHYGGASPPTQDALGTFGHHLGMAFQMVDDRLDLSGEEIRTGKSLGRDLLEGKTTLPVILWRDRLSGLSRPEAVQTLQAAWKEPAAAGQLAARVAQSGALTAADERAEEEIGRAVEALASLPDSPARTLLCRIAPYVLERRR